jgi:hypothetical protein
VVHGSPDDGAEGPSATRDVRGSVLPTSLANRDAFFANLGQFLAPASPATDAPGHANATDAGRQSAPATVGSDLIQVSHQDAGHTPDDDLGLWVPATL